MVATHEAGHAVAAACLPGTYSREGLDRLAQDIAALGYTQQLLPDRGPVPDDPVGKLSNRLCLLGGRTAEDIVLSPTGAQNDLQRATDLVAAWWRSTA